MSWTAAVFDPCGRLPDSVPDRPAIGGPQRILALGPLRAAVGEDVGAHEGVLCALDGQLDNELELAEQLGARPGADAPRLLRAGWERWGEELPRRLRGDFALLVWDERSRRGLLARDHLGVRGVYISEAGGGLRVATELHRLLAMLPATPPPDPLGVAHWIAISGRPGTGTLYEGIRRLAPGSLATFDRSGVRERRYWNPRYQGALEISTPEVVHELRGALQLAVTRRLEHSAPTGVLMSGGLDSASVAALAASAAPERTLAFSGVFPEHPGVDESQLVAQLRERLRLGGLTAHVRTGGLLASALDWVKATELPLVAWGDFWTLPLLRGAAATGVRSVLGGDGGDELFDAREHLIADLVRGGRIPSALSLARELPGAGDRPPPREVARVFAELGLAGALPWRAQRAWRAHPAWMAQRAWSGATRSGRAELLLGPLARRLRESEDPQAWKRLEGPRWWAHLAHGLSSGIEQNGVFEHQRLRGGLAGVRCRHPLLDFDLVELALRLPPEATFDRHLSRPLLRAAMQGELPETVRLRPVKAWFDSLIVDCLSGPDRRAIELLLGGRGCELGAYVDLARVRATLLDVDPATATSRFGWMHQLWRLVTIELWLRRKADPDGPLLPQTARASRARVELVDERRPTSAGGNIAAPSPIAP